MTKVKQRHVLCRIRRPWVTGNICLSLIKTFAISPKFTLCNKMHTGTHFTNMVQRWSRNRYLLIQLHPTFCLGVVVIPIDTANIKVINYFAVVVRPSIDNCSWGQCSVRGDLSVCWIVHALYFGFVVSLDWFSINEGHPFYRCPFNTRTHNEQPIAKQ